VSDSGISQMQIYTSLQTNNHASTTSLSFFTGWMPFLPPNQQRQSTEGDLERQYARQYKHTRTHTHTHTHDPSAFAHLLLSDDVTY